MQITKKLIHRNSDNIAKVQIDDELLILLFSTPSPNGFRPSAFNYMWQLFNGRRFFMDDLKNLTTYENENGVQHIRRWFFSGGPTAAAHIPRRKIEK